MGARAIISTAAVIQPTMPVKFSDAIDSWTKRSKKRMTAVRRRAIVYLGQELTKTKPRGGKVPFLTGNLYRSLLASKEGMPNIKSGKFTGDNVGIVAATIENHEAVWLGYQAVYARRRNYGFQGADSKGRVYNEIGDYFVENAILEWRNIVARAIKDIKQENQ